MENLRKYTSQVIEQTGKLLVSGSVPSQEQLTKYITQVVLQLHKLIANAPTHVKQTLMRPFEGLWQFEENKPVPGVYLTGDYFLQVMHQIDFLMSDPSAMKENASPALTIINKDEIIQKSREIDQQKQRMADAAKDRSGAAMRKLESEMRDQKKAQLDYLNQRLQTGYVHAPAPKFAADTKTWKQDLSQRVVPCRRDAAPPVSDACKRLPTYEKKDWILGAIRSNRVTVISGDTGCGKSTLIPQLVCDAVNLVDHDKVVVCTQPRRVAAITLAEYVAKDRGQELADDVGYQIRFINKFSDHTRLIYATTAIVLRRLHNEPELESIGCLILDEVHERDVYTDFLLLLLRKMFLDGKMPQLKIVIMSATLKADDFASYFADVNGDNALKPVFVPGRMFPVEDYYFEDAACWLEYVPEAKGGKGGKGKGKKGKDGKDSGPSEEELDAIREKICDDMTAKGRPGSVRVQGYNRRVYEACALWKPNTVYLDLIYDLILYFHHVSPKGDNGEGSILVFLPGWGDISKLFIKLFRSQESLKLITLHSLMTPEQQHEAFEKAPYGLRKVVLSTNIAEASVTIDDIVYVIDSGIRKERSFDPINGSSSLDTTMVTRANAVQRRGRAGRCQEGVVVHLFPSYKFSTFGESPVPQMLSASMEEVVLQSKVIYGGTLANIDHLLRTSMAAPKKEAVDQAVDLLQSMDCLTPSGHLTVLGRAVAAIPVQPCVAKMLLLAGAFRCIKPAAVVAAILAVKNPFQQTVGQKQDNGKMLFNKGFDSDHITCVQAYVEWRNQVARGNGENFCDQMGLSPETMDMAHMMVQQFVSFMVDAGYDGDDVKDGDFGECDFVKAHSSQDAILRCAMTAGLWPNVCVLYKGNKSAYWYTTSNEEVSPFMGSVNAQYQMKHSDGQEFMIYSDAMKMGRFNSIMDSTVILSPYALLFAKALSIDRKKGEIRFDNFYAYCDSSARWIDELLKLRDELLPRFQECIEERELSMFPRDLLDRMTDFVTQPPMALREISLLKTHVKDEPGMKNVSMFKWPVDEAQ